MVHFIAKYWHYVSTAGIMFTKLFTYFFSPLSLIPTCHLSISHLPYTSSSISFFIFIFSFTFFLLPFSAVLRLSSATLLISDSLSVVEVKSIKTGRSTCTTTALHLVHWPAVSHIPAAVLQR